MRNPFEMRRLAASLTPTERLGGPGGGERPIVDPELRPVIGFRLSPGQWDGEDVIKELYPLYDANEVAPADESMELARDGYVVGGLVVIADKYVNAVQVVFMRYDGERIDPNDNYRSEWIGARTNQPPRILGGDGRKVLGTFGGKGLILNSLGLLLGE
jgi:hypothetical protein